MARQSKSDAQTQTMASAHLQERREVRYVVAFPIEVTGIRDGEAFRERTVTQNASEWGCGFVLSFELKREDIVSIHVISEDPGESRQCLYQVTRVSKEAHQWVVGAWKIGSENMWGVELEEIASATVAHRELRDQPKGLRIDSRPKDGNR